MTLHPRGDVDCISKDTVTRVARSNDTCYDGTAVDTYTNADRANARKIAEDGRFGRSLNAVNSKFNNAFGMIRRLILHKIAYAYEGITNGLDFEYIMLDRQLIKLEVQSV